MILSSKFTATTSLVLGFASQTLVPWALVGFYPISRKSNKFLGLVASSSSLLIFQRKTHYFSISFSWLRWKLAREAFLHFVGFPGWTRKAYFFISAQMCGPFSLMFVRLDVRKLLFPFVRSFPLSSSEVLKIETILKIETF